MDKHTKITQGHEIICPSARVKKIEEHKIKISIERIKDRQREKGGNTYLHFLF
jgi:hypothetical protein